MVLWSRGGAHLTKPGWSKPHTHSNPTNLALFTHKITLYRFNQGGAHTIAGGLKWEQGAEPSPEPPHFNHCISVSVRFELKFLTRHVAPKPDSPVQNRTPHLATLPARFPRSHPVALSPARSLSLVISPACFGHVVRLRYTWKWKNATVGWMWKTVSPSGTLKSLK